MAGSVMRWVIVTMGMLGVCVLTRDARADVHPRLVLNFAGTQFTGISSSVVETSSSVNGTMQYRVSLSAMTSDSKKLQCTLVVPTAAVAESYRTELLNERTALVTCSVTHTVTTDPAAGTVVLLNMVSPGAGDSLTIESH